MLTDRRFRNKKFFGPKYGQSKERPISITGEKIGHYAVRLGMSFHTQKDGAAHNPPFAHPQQTDDSKYRANDVTREDTDHRTVENKQIKTTGRLKYRAMDHPLVGRGAKTHIIPVTPTPLQTTHNAWREKTRRKK